MEASTLKPLQWHHQAPNVIFASSHTSAHIEVSMQKMHEKAAQCITDTIKFKHHGVKVPNVAPAKQIAKAVKDLTAAVRNDPTKGPPDYIEAVPWLRAVLLNEKQQERPVPGPQGEKKEVPLHNPSQITQQPVALKAPRPTNEVST
eukprot:10759116-Ditylum_brightwellii.AAC.1